jgi:hypothetical protein
MNRQYECQSQQKQRALKLNHKNKVMFSGAIMGSTFRQTRSVFFSRSDNRASDIPSVVFTQLLCTPTVYVHSAVLTLRVLLHDCPICPVRSASSAYCEGLSPCQKTFQPKPKALTSGLRSRLKKASICSFVDIPSSIMPESLTSVGKSLIFSNSF